MTDLEALEKVAAGYKEWLNGKKVFIHSTDMAVAYNTVNEIIKTLKEAQAEPHKAITLAIKTLQNHGVNPTQLKATDTSLYSPVIVYDKAEFKVLDVSMHYIPGDVCLWIEEQKTDETPKLDVCDDSYYTEGATGWWIKVPEKVSHLMSVPFPVAKILMIAQDRFCTHVYLRNGGQMLPELQVHELTKAPIKED